jgi:hypothetical protein
MQVLQVNLRNHGQKKDAAVEMIQAPSRMEKRLHLRFTHHGRDNGRKNACENDPYQLGSNCFQCLQEPSTKM